MDTRIVEPSMTDEKADGPHLLPVLGHRLRVDTKLVSDCCPIDCGETAGIRGGGRSLHCHVDLRLQTGRVELREKLLESIAGVGFPPPARAVPNALQVPDRDLAVFHSRRGWLCAAQSPSTSSPGMSRGQPRDW